MSDPDATVFSATEDSHGDSHDQTVFANESNSETHDGVDRTLHAAQAMELGVVFRHRFHTATFGISPKWRVRLTTPDGMSTEGGKRARQSIVIHKEGAPSAGTFTLGYFDGVHEIASIKTHDVMCRAYELRHRREFELVESEYERLVDELRRFAAGLGLEVRMVSAETTAGRPVGLRKKGEARQVSVTAIVIALVGILGVGVAIGYILAN